LKLYCKLLLIAFLAFILVGPFTLLNVNAKSDNFTLEAEQNWDTYRIGGTCVFGTQNIIVADVDGDTSLEIVTGGFSYKAENGVRVSLSQAPLKVWSWNGQNVTLKSSIEWAGIITSLFAADVDQDGTMEIITAGSFYNETSNYASLRIWHLSNGKLMLQANSEGTSIGAIYVADADKDGKQEILTVGRLRTETANTTQLVLWDYQGNTLAIDKILRLDDSKMTSANSVFATNLDNNGDVAVIIGGYTDTLANSKGQVCIWLWNGSTFQLSANQNWQTGDGTAKTIAGGTMGNTVVNNVKAADLDGDGVKELVTAGFTYDGENVNGQIKVWRWNGTVLSIVDSQEWATDYLTEAKSIALNDVDGDGKTEIVQSGIAAAKNSFNNSEAAHDRAQLRVWGLSDGVLTLEQGRDWTFDNGACAWNVGSGDVDKDGIVEIVTIGCSAYGSLCDPDMRIWSLPMAEAIVAYPDYLLYVAGVLLTGLGVSALIYLVSKKRHH
jgi:hypothetical protein